MSYENACDVICVHEDKVNNALSFLEDDKSKKLLNILEKICDEKKLKIILSLNTLMQIGYVGFSVLIIILFTIWMRLT
ncbi:hypothetical protein ACF1CU_12675, partial [Staphylococcus saprophyticus]